MFPFQHCSSWVNRAKHARQHVAGSGKAAEGTAVVAPAQVNRARAGSGCQGSTTGAQGRVCTGKLLIQRPHGTQTSRITVLSSRDVVNTLPLRYSLSILINAWA
uniref:Uncharacterized protein n=1 Tax=Columba livia TaxID=8932 RepID=R7VR18_COLLI